MLQGDWLAVTSGQALRFFFERLQDVSDADRPPAGELLYNASLLAHFASTSTTSGEGFPPSPTNLRAIFELFVLDQSGHADPEIMEAAGSQCLLLTGFFRDQVAGRHNVRWYAALGAGFYDQAGRLTTDATRGRMMRAMSVHFDFWRHQQGRLARELRDAPRLIPGFNA